MMERRKIITWLRPNKRARRGRLVQPVWLLHYGGEAYFALAMDRQLRRGVRPSRGHSCRCAIRPIEASKAPIRKGCFTSLSVHLSEAYRSRTVARTCNRRQEGDADALRFPPKNVHPTLLNPMAIGSPDIHQRSVK